MSTRESVQNIMPCIKEATPPVGIALGVLAVALKNHLIPNVGDVINDLPAVLPPIVGAALMYLGFQQLLKK